MLEKKKLAPFFKEKLDGKLSENYIDLHIHTTASDGFIKPQLIKKLFANTSHLISVTDHNAIKSNIQLAEESNLNIIPGIEVGCSDGFELLIYFRTQRELKDFYKKYVKPFKMDYDITRTKQNHEHFLKHAAKYNSFISIPHITGIAQKNYLRNKDYIEEIIQTVDAIETYNHSMPQKRNKKAKKTRKQNQKYATFGSDAHIKQSLISFYEGQEKKFFNTTPLKTILHNLYSIIPLISKRIEYIFQTN
ncbi:PHP domain-containing protein [Halanaerobacter jeridensis]|uniref:Metal-dependent phosphoesterase TrpH n=1 Tax=Halanaerobacter jeridensis TaxID=706427 RepID=A0A938XRD9_9FIRM|nr:PHP domain-containing protein [Halanaerobacter jeridensis]MBM7556261.1 putative metal-dependent phosphoesterase TrpH [Halanaerobacter jeridensis]